MPIPKGIVDASDRDPVLVGAKRSNRVGGLFTAVGTFPRIGHNILCRVWGVAQNRIGYAAFGYGVDLCPDGASCAVFSGLEGLPFYESI